ncbi:MAG: hypothetical protein QXP51_01155 [Candidatus Hadarchaeales archaeon]
MPFNVVFFTEGGENAGFGHITRCRALSDAFEEVGRETTFVVKGDEKIVKFLNRDVVLENWIDDFETFKSFLSSADLVVIDSYLASLDHYRWASELKRCLFVDDFRRLDYPPKSIVLNGSIYAEKLRYPKRKGVRYLLGSKFAPLRRAFWEVEEKVVNPEIEKIFVSFGLNDTRRLIPSVVKTLSEKFPQCELCVVVDPQSPSGKKLLSMDLKNVKIFGNLSAEEMKELVLECDVAVSAGGQTTYELARVGVPSVLIAVAENQLLNCKGWQGAGFAYYVGFAGSENTLRKIIEHLKKLEDEKIRSKMSKIGRKYVDGQGARRVVKEFQNSG